MHQYLKAIGFDNINTRYDLKDLMEDVEAGFTHQTIVSYRPGEDFCELRREYGQCIGVSLCGELDDDDNFYPDYYFPYFEGSGISTYADIAIERKIEKEQYVGMCEDSKIGISLIFTLQNGIEYMRERQAGFTAGVTTSVTLSGLALSGMILLPVLKDERRLKSEQEASDNRKMLLNAARNGDQSAIETLTLDDIDIYSQVSRRLANEDVFSIVDTYFMPYGVECDLYSIMGEILAVRHRTNSATGVELYQMKLNVNEMQFDVCVPAEEVMGEPEIGRRFKGTIWLQGYINF
ncbi:DUF3881 family protein [[Ruminococcus] torques]|uniref:DUF3881 family protein n=1 Tax=[Ruminococcus] torques TaxID=33039 RepID=UPI0025A380B0|nr:DUF3881 family protein [[Ruminococcus] torques]MBS5398552.1 DUF3881 family protein [Lachnospiraceae bacterium]MDM8235998.1 DUF3881 family protein [[Ruminococcus] torques]